MFKNLSHLRNFWPGRRWAAALILGGMLVSTTASLAVMAKTEDMQHEQIRQYNYCRKIGQPWVQISSGTWACDMEGYFRPWPESQSHRPEVSR